MLKSFYEKHFRCPQLSSQHILVPVLILVAITGVAIRFLDLRDPPLDFIPWRQLRAATIARSMYYQQLQDMNPDTVQRAVELGRNEILEPPIYETITAASYRLAGGEYLWIARVWGITFWIAGGAGLFLFARKISSLAGAITSLAYYLLLPFAVVSSRSFLPDVLMTASLALGVWALYRWLETGRWRWAVAAGSILGFSVLVKVFAVYPAALAAVFGVLSTWPLKKAIRKPQVWITAAIMAAIPAYYYIYLLQGSGGSYLQGWVIPYSSMLIDPGFYIRWISVLSEHFYFGALVLSLAGLSLMPKSSRNIPLGLFLGYVLFGMSVPSLILSHTYYNIVLVLIIAIPLCTVGEAIHRLVSRKSLLSRIILAAGFMLAAGYPTVLARNHLMGKDYRQEIIGWERIGKELPKDGPMVGFTHDYNMRLKYYGWSFVQLWPQVSDMQMNTLAGADFALDGHNEEYLLNRLQPYDYFVVTLFGELDEQPALKATLYDNFAIYKEGDGYIIFDLRSQEN